MVKAATLERGYPYTFEQSGTLVLSPHAEEVDEPILIVVEGVEEMMEAGTFCFIIIQGQLYEEIDLIIIITVRMRQRRTRFVS